MMMCFYIYTSYIDWQWSPQFLFKVHFNLACRSSSFVLTNEVTWQRRKLLLVQNFINSSRWTSLLDVSLTHTADKQQFKSTIPC